MAMVRLALSTLGGVILLPACSPLESAPERWERVVGIIEIGGEQPSPVQVPEPVVAGIPFDATIVTYGSGTCTRPDGAEVEITGLEGEITPYDLEYRGPWERGGYHIACTDDLAPYPRDISLLFDEPGDAQIVVIGRPVPGDTLVEFRIDILVHP